MSAKTGRVSIIDATLREGTQAPGARFSPEQSAEIARYLVYIGVDMIECGHPLVSSGEMARVQKVVNLGLPVPVLVHARAREEDVFAASRSGAKWVGIFCGINDISRRIRLVGYSVDQVLDRIRSSISYARTLGLKVRYTLEDASRTSWDLTVQAFRCAVEAGANRICFADSVGKEEPEELRHLIFKLRQEFAQLDLEVHLHDDRGLAMANALAAIEVGANWISTSVNSLGERSGIVDISVLLANLHYRGMRRMVHTEALQDLSRYVAACARASVDDRRPVIGENAFTHEARLHTRAVEVDEIAYSWLAPGEVGRRTRIARKKLPTHVEDLIIKPVAIPATELRYHREGPGTRYVMIDERFVPDCRQYCIVRYVPSQQSGAAEHVDAHSHWVDSLFLFLGHRPDLTGLEVEVRLGDRKFPVSSPASVFIPASLTHSYRIIEGSGLYVNHVLAGSYNESLLEPYPWNSLKAQ